MTLSSPSLDLGPANCGATQTVATAFTIGNDGGGALRFSVRSDDPNFELIALTDTLAPKSARQVSLRARPPGDAVAGEVFTGSLVVESDDPTARSIVVPLRARAEGHALRAEPGTVDFGVQGLGVDAGRFVILRNDGTQPADLVLTEQSQEFSVLSSSSFRVDAGSTAVVQLGFSGATAGQYATTLNVQASGAHCGPVLAGVPLVAQATSSVVRVDTTELFFGDAGRVACGTTASGQSVRLDNVGDAGVSYTLTLGRGASSPFTVTPSSGVVAASASTSITVTPKPVPSQASTSLDAFADSLLITTNAPNDTGTTVRLHQSAHGAVMRFSPSSLEFGATPQGTVGAAHVSLVNGGSAPATFQLLNDGGAIDVAQRTLTARPGANQVDVSYRPTPDAGLERAQFELAMTSGVLCAPLPLPLEVSGYGTSRTYTVSPVAFDFGEVGCGSQASAQSLSIANRGTQDFTVTTMLQKSPSPFTVTMNPASGVVAAGSSLVVTITPARVPAAASVDSNALGDVLTLTTSLLDEPTTVPLRMTAKGAVLSASRTAINFGTVQTQTTARSQFIISNAGNAEATLAITTQGDSAFSLPSSVTVPAGAFVTVTASYSPVAELAQSGSATLRSPASVTCAPDPQPISLSGTGVATPNLSVSRTSIDFNGTGFVACGAQAAAETVVVTNPKSTSFTLTARFESELDGGVSWFTVAGGGTLNANGLLTLTVTPKPTPGVVDFRDGGGVYDDVLVVNVSNSTVNESRRVQLNERAQGVVLRLSPSSITLNPTLLSPTDSAPFSITNAGNVSARPTFRVSSPRFSLSPPAEAPTTGATGTVSCQVQLGADNGTLSIVDAGAPLCDVLPRAIDLRCQ